MKHFVVDDNKDKVNEIRRRLQVDHLWPMLEDGGIYSLPLGANESAWEAAEGLDVESAAAHLEVASQDNIFFQVIDLNAKQKKALRTDASRRIKHMDWPVSIQRLSIWPQKQAYPGVCHDVCVETFPEVVDLLCLAPWMSLRSTLR